MVRTSLCQRSVQRTGAHSRLDDPPSRWHPWETGRISVSGRRRVGMQTDDLSAPNMFRHYVQGENHFTNALVSILAISRQDNPLFLASFMSDLLGLQPQQKISTFRVQRDYSESLRRTDTIVDAEISGKDICMFSDMLSQFGAYLYDGILLNDLVGVIMKMSFGKKSGVDNDTYIRDILSGEGIGRQWNTPRKYRELEGPGRKLLLYDKIRRAITVEVEIESVEKTGAESEFPWANIYKPDTLCVLDPPIPLSRICSIPNLEHLHTGRSPYRLITHDEYQRLRRPSEPGDSSHTSPSIPTTARSPGRYNPQPV